MDAWLTTKPHGMWEKGNTLGLPILATGLNFFRSPLPPAPFCPHLERSKGDVSGQGIKDAGMFSDHFFQSIFSKFDMFILNLVILDL